MERRELGRGGPGCQGFFASRKKELAATIIYRAAFTPRPRMSPAGSYRRFRLRTRWPFERRHDSRLRDSDLRDAAKSR
jgi:hypothetical protein